MTTRKTWRSLEEARDRRKLSPGILHAKESNNFLEEQKLPKINSRKEIVSRAGHAINAGITTSLVGSLVIAARKRNVLEMLMVCLNTLTKLLNNLLLLLQPPSLHSYLISLLHSFLLSSLSAPQRKTSFSISFLPQCKRAIKTPLKRTVVKKSLSNTVYLTTEWRNNYSHPSESM